MGEYIVRELRLTQAESDALRRRYWQRYGATLLGLVRHHGVKPAHFLHDTHLLPGLEQRVRGHRARPGRAAPPAGAQVHPDQCTGGLRDARAGRAGHRACSTASFTIEDMHMFGHLRPKPDARMLRWMARGCGCRPRAACWWKTRWCTRRPRAAWAWARCGCSAGCAACRSAAACDRRRGRPTWTARCAACATCAAARQSDTA
jgi:hypothetical protein